MIEFLAGFCLCPVVLFLGFYVMVRLYNPDLGGGQ